MTPEAYHPSQRQQEPLSTPDPVSVPTDQLIFQAPEKTPSHRIPSGETTDAALANIMEHPEDYPFAKEQHAQLGNIQVAVGPWGDLIDSPLLESVAEKLGVLTPETREMIRNSGFPHGYYYPQDADMSSPEFQALQALRGAMLARMVVDRRDWKHIDTLVVGSISSIADTPKRVAHILSQWGITVDTVQFYGQACNSALGAIIDLTRRSQQGETIGPSVVVGLDSLSGSQVDPKDIKLMRTFGNGGGAIAFVPGKDIEHITGRTIFVKDEKGVIKIHHTYELPTEGKKPLYPWYEVTEGSEDAIARTNEGIFVRMVAPEGPYAQMNGFDTFKFFSRYMPRLVVDVALDYVKEGSLYGKLSPLAAGHQPANPVNTGLNKYINRLLEGIHASGEFIGKKIDRSIVQRLPKEISIPWLMHHAGINNISAGTFLVHATEMIKQGMLKCDQPTLLVGYGIGSVMQADVVIFH